MTTVGIFARVSVGVSAAVIKMPGGAAATVQHHWPAPACICCSRLQEDVSDSAARAPEVQAGHRARGPPVIHYCFVGSFFFFLINANIFYNQPRWPRILCW